ncbi:hypothetical protein DsansV1_C21g0169211 [Dioscorea sansibarensis]
MDINLTFTRKPSSLIISPENHPVPRCKLIGQVKWINNGHKTLSEKESERLRLLLSCFLICS